MKLSKLAFTATVLFLTVIAHADVRERLNELRDEVNQAYLDLGYETEFAHLNIHEMLRDEDAVEVLERLVETARLVQATPEAVHAVFPKNLYVSPPDDPYMFGDKAQLNDGDLFVTTDATAQDMADVIMAAAKASYLELTTAEQIAKLIQASPEFAQRVLTEQLARGPITIAKVTAIVGSRTVNVRLEGLLVSSGEALTLDLGELQYSGDLQ